MLIFLAKAEIVETKKDYAVRSVSKTLPWPSVIRLKTYVNVPYKKIILSRKNILKRDKHKCVYCGRGDLPLTMDHIIPRSKGGVDSWENLAAACMPCNNRKGDRTPSEAGMRMRSSVYVPNHIMFIKNIVGRIDERWKPFLFQH
ncbi:MAG: HNH endonuclease [Melioribacteraceae bacterium]|nr:HNH endonuclease [Melioribacteraceae bacterium]